MRGAKCELTVHDSPQQNSVSEHGMRTHTEHAQALLIASRLPQFLWEEAMKHMTQIQDRTPTCANAGKSPYEMRHKKKPHLAGIQEFGAAAYIKDLKAGKLDSHAKVSQFIGYDLELKGYQIYWLQKQSVMVEHNVVFNEDDVCINDDDHILAGDAVDEGGRDKIIQPPASSINALISAPTAQPLPSVPMPDLNLANSILFPSKPSAHPQPEPLEGLLPEALLEDDLPQELGQGQYVQKKPPGAYKRMAEGLPLKQTLQNSTLKFWRMRMTGKQSYPQTSCSLAH